MNITMTSSIFIGILLGIILSLGFSRMAIQFCNRIGLIDVPGRASHKVHAFPIPIAGGIIFTISLLLLYLTFGLWHFKHLNYILAGAGIIFLEGLADDFQSLSALPKLVGQISATLLIIIAGIRVRIFEAPSFFWSGSGQFYVGLDIAITLLWVVGITNAMNLIDSMDGIVSGICAWSLGFYMLATANGIQPELSLLCALLVGVCIGLTYHNQEPARQFLGDSGAQTLGFLLASISILYAPQERSQTISWFVPIMILGMPIFDTTLVVYSRLRRRTPFFQGRLDHTYHRLIRLGMDTNRAVMTIQLGTIILSCLAFIALSLPPALANGLFLISLSCGSMLILWMDDRKRWP